MENGTKGLYLKLLVASLIVISSCLSAQAQIYTPELDSAYHLHAQKKVKESIPLFENHIKIYPEDTKVWLQLAFIYDSQGQYSRSLRYFKYVRDHSTNQEEKEQASASVTVMQDKVVANAKKSLDFDVQIFYDTYQKNFIAGMTGYYNYRVTPQFITGAYVDAYTDSKSSPPPGDIFNDRYLELGVFARFLILKGLNLEGRIGYVREFDLDKSSINVSPRLTYGMRFGEAQSYIGKKPASKSSVFMDLYSSLSYDYKFNNGFFQLGLVQAWRNNIVGYSFVDVYLKEYLTMDSRKLDYNNLVEAGPGVRYKPNLAYFPLLWVEATYKYYLPIWGNKKDGTKQIKVGMSFSFRLKV